jgi:hypothetical protein
MVYVARQELDAAERALTLGAAVQDSDGSHRLRFPSSGLRYLLGLVHLHGGHVAEAIEQFEQETARGHQRVYATEFALAARNAWGFALLAQHAVDPAINMFRQVLDVDPVQPRARLGLALTFEKRHDRAGVEHELRHTVEDIRTFERAGRLGDVAMLTAAEHVVRQRPEQAVTTLRKFLECSPPGPAGWLIPIDPLFEPLRASGGYDDVMATLAMRAR